MIVTRDLPQISWVVARVLRAALRPLHRWVDWRLTGTEELSPAQRALVDRVLSFAPSAGPPMTPGRRLEYRARLARAAQLHRRALAARLSAALACRLVRGTVTSDLTRDVRDPWAGPAALSVLRGGSARGSAVFGCAV